MEIDLMKENWPTIDLFDNINTQKTVMTTTPMATTKKTTMKEENSMFSIWEENYQDLSGWCIDTFQGQCAFPIGEFDTHAYSGTKSEDNGVSINKICSSGIVSGDITDETVSLGESSLNVPELPVIVQETSEQGDDINIAIKSEIMDTTSSVLLDPIDSTLNLRTDDWIQLNNVKGENISTIIAQQEKSTRKSNVISAEYPIVIPLDIAKEEKNNWDTINTFGNTQSDTFDLLSYLCDDNIESPDGSVVSRDSGPTISSISSTAIQSEPRVTSKRSSRHSRRNYNESSLSSSSSASIAAISAALDSVTKMSKRSSRNRDARTKRKDSEDRNQNVRGQKRSVESDSEDFGSDGNYRESREKNNEASRKSRMNKKAKENEIMSRANDLERDNRILRMKVEELDKLVTSMRTAILKSALKKSG